MAMVFTRTQANSQNFPGNLVSVKLQALFLGYHKQPKLFLATFHFPDLTRLLNDPIYHDPCWPPMPMNFPSNIPKFEAKPNEDPGEHVTTFHLWCSSNSLKDDSVQLQLFQCTLIGSAMK